MVSFSQTPDSRHNDMVFQNNTSILGKKYYYSNNNIYVASGCFITISEGIEILSNINMQNNIYGDEDILIGEILNKNNCVNVVSESKVNHPYCLDIEYNEWKKQKVLNFLSSI